jgi:hypothetical protein
MTTKNYLLHTTTTAGHMKVEVLKTFTISLRPQPGCISRAEANRAEESAAVDLMNNVKWTVKHTKKRIIGDFKPDPFGEGWTFGVVTTGRHRVCLYNQTDKDYLFSQADETQDEDTTNKQK